MKKIIYTCDRCRKEIKDSPYRILVDKLYVEDPEQEVKGIMCPQPHPEIRDLDLCRDCTDFLVGLLKKHMRAPAAINDEFEEAVQEIVATSQSDSSAKREAGQKLDRGKIRALRNAGWSVKAIAEELQRTDKAIYGVLQEMGMPVGKKKAPEPEPTEQSTNN